MVILIRNNNDGKVEKKKSLILQMLKEVQEEILSLKKVI